MSKLALHKSGKATSDITPPGRSLQRKMTTNASNDPLEHQADHMASAQQNRSNSGDIQTMRTAPSNQEDAPESVNATLNQSGQPLDGGVRKDMEQRIGHDFSRVRVHTDQAASKSARDVQAHAYTAGQHVVFGNNEYQPASPRGRSMLAHELTHVAQQSSLPAQQQPVQRLGFGEFLARLFGGGTFSTDETDEYLGTLQDTKKPEGNNDSDNKARSVVSAGKHKDLPLSIRVLLIEEMLDGATLDDDEEAILKIVRDASPLDREVIVERVGRDRLKSKLDGEEFDKLISLLAEVKRAGKQEVPTQWVLGYSVQGASEVRNSAPAIEVLALDSTPQSESSSRPVATSAVVNKPSGAPSNLADGIDHPRNLGGKGNLAFRVMPVDSEGTPVPDDSSAPEQVTAEYAPVSYDKRTIEAHVDVEYDRKDKVSVEKSKANTNTSATEKSSTTGTSDSVTNTTGKKSTNTKSNTKSAQQGQTDSESKTEGSSESKTDGTSESSTKGSSSTHSDSKSSSDTKENSNTKGSGTSKATTKGTDTTKGTQTTDSTTDRSSKKITANLGGKLGGDLSDLAKKWAGKSIGGGVLGRFLGKAGAAGARLLGLIRKFNPITMLLSVVGDQFKLEGTLTGEMAYEWETSTTKSTTTNDSKTDTDSTTTTDSNSNSDTTRNQHTDSTGSEDSKTDSQQTTTGKSSQSTGTKSSQDTKGTSTEKKTGSEQTDSSSDEHSTSKAVTKGSSTSDTDKNSESTAVTTGTKETEQRWVPVIKKSSVIFKVK